MPEDASTETRVIASAKQGSADVLILALLKEQDLHGYEIARRIEDRSDGTLRFTLASLYETLYRLEERGLLHGRWLERPGAGRGDPGAVGEVSRHGRSPSSG